MENADELKNVLARLKPEIGGALEEANAPPVEDEHPLPTLQPENDFAAEDVKQFRPRKYRAPDEYDASYVAIPAPTWPEPGAVLTHEIWCAYQKELILRAEANNRLREFCYFLTHEKAHLAAFPPARKPMDPANGQTVRFCKTLNSGRPRTFRGSLDYGAAEKFRFPQPRS